MDPPLTVSSDLVDSKGAHVNPHASIAGDIIGCGIDFSQHRAFFTKNGTFLGTSFFQWCCTSAPIG